MKKKKAKYRFRNARTGHYCTEVYARKHPATTVREHVK